MQNPLISKLLSCIDLGADDRAALEELCTSSMWRDAGEDLISEGDQPSDVFLLLSGWACRYKYLRDGGRQIMAYLLPGDLCDTHVFILKTMDHSIGLLSNAEVVRIPKEAILTLTDERPDIAKAFWWSTLVDEGVLREWLVNIGKRDAYARLAHLFCELWVRLCHVGLTRDDQFTLPVTQEQLGDSLGLTSVHVNRVLGRMRNEGLVATRARSVTILNGDRLHEVAGFNPNYLHLLRNPASGQRACELDNL
ncbi:CRP-like cAMP-binding protein [Sphingomonas jejuensis]|uniref:CRP-like cAMP-binding protein n=1 Tax=Sphingomonas jejuensis TaxID=904715 RepID=A0ABX0XPG8_9SPHN|nr:CRP-like cAMP-binding protein [Sphingomonas jejuensis]